MSQQTDVTLGTLLKSTRNSIGKSLRDVERATGISNGYLSQLESDAIKQPSPKHLHELAQVYQLEYERLMDLAGYVPTRKVGAAPVPSQFSGLEELTNEDRMKIQAYIEDLRDARRVRDLAQEDRVGSKHAPK